jgi:hypothetical protein
VRRPERLDRSVCALASIGSAGSWSVDYALGHLDMPQARQKLQVFVDLPASIAVEVCSGPFTASLATSPNHAPKQASSNSRKK